MTRLLILLLIITGFTAPLEVGIPFEPIENSVVVLRNGEANATQKDTGATVILIDGRLSIVNENENIQVILPDGIVTASGTVEIEVSADSLFLRSFKGYQRFISSGGVPGETVAQGYERAIHRRSMNADRRMIEESQWDSFCDEIPELREILGCIDVMAFEPDVTVEPVKLPVIFHAVRWNGVFPQNLEQQTFLDQLMLTAEAQNIAIAPIISSGGSYHTVWELEQAGQDFRIIDITMTPDEVDNHRFIAKVSVFHNSGTSSSDWIEIPGQIEPSVGYSTSTFRLNPLLFQEIVNFIEKNVQ